MDNAPALAFDGESPRLRENESETSISEKLEANYLWKMEIGCSADSMWNYKTIPNQLITND